MMTSRKLKALRKAKEALKNPATEGKGRQELTASKYNHWIELNPEFSAKEMFSDANQ